MEPKKQSARMAVRAMRARRQSESGYFFLRVATAACAVCVLAMRC